MKRTVLVTAVMLTLACGQARKDAEQIAGLCSQWRARATTASDSLQVDMTCALMAEVRGARRAGEAATAVGAGAIGAAAAHGAAVRTR